MSNIFNVYKCLAKEGANEKELAKIKPASFYKYVAMFKKAGFSLKRYKTIYKIVTYTASAKLSDAEIGLIAYLKLLSDNLFSKSKNRLFCGLIDKIMKLTDKNTEDSVEEKFAEMKTASDTNLYCEKLRAFEEYKDKNISIDILLKNKKRMTLIPQEIIYKNKKIYFSFADNSTGPRFP